MAPANEPPARRRSTPAALAVAAGILLSRISGLVRERVFAHYLGASDAAGAFKAALRIPNLLQNLFGEGVLSASFIPVYARLRAEKRDQEASQLAEAIFALLALTTTILFTGVGLLVFSAWCLGVLNSHRKFFLSYTAPVIWNVAIIVAFYLHRNAV